MRVTVPGIEKGQRRSFKKDGIIQMILDSQKNTGVSQRCIANIVRETL